LFGFLKRLRRKSSTNSLQKEGVLDTLQRQLDTFQPPPPQEKRRPLVSEVSIKEIENEVNDYLKSFESYVKRIKDNSLGLEELTKLLKSGEISENAYMLIMDELGVQLSQSVEDIFRLREVLELARAKAKLEWAKEKIGAHQTSPGTFESARKRYAGRDKDVVQSDFLREPESGQAIPPSLYRWEVLVSEIDGALSSLAIEEETAIIEQYVSLIKEKLALEARSEEIEHAVSVCRQRLNSISERWASIRRSQVEQIMNLELESSQVKDQIKELEVRFHVAEISQDKFERRMSDLQGGLRKVERKISDVRRFIDDMDMKIFRCSELLRENK
jgi:chromosome segregation ATPase